MGSRSIGNLCNSWVHCSNRYNILCCSLLVQAVYNRAILNILGVQIVMFLMITGYHHFCMAIVNIVDSDGMDISDGLTP